MTIILTCFFKQHRQGKYLLRYFTTKKLFSRLENVFYDILERKNAFLGYKKKKSKSQKIDIFPKRLTHGLGPKMAIFPNFFFLGNIGQDNVCYDILEQKKAFLDYRNKKFKKSEN